MTVVTATGIETRTARRALRGLANVVEVGIGAVRAPLGGFDVPVISCGLAGGVGGDDTGTVLIPSEVIGPDGERVSCDADLVDALVRAARCCGTEPDRAPLGTARSFVTGASRERYAFLGCAGVDMESALIRAPRMAAVRVVLDTPQHEISDAWLRPWSALVRPRTWLELPWLAHNGPRCAALAARIVAASLGATP